MRESKTGRDSGFSIALIRGGDAGGAWLYLVGALLYAGFFYCLWEMFGLAGTGASLLPPFALGCVYSAIGCGLLRKRRLAAIAAALIPAAYVIAGSRYVSEGWNVTANQVFLALEYYVGRILPRYECNEALSQALCASLFLLLPSIALAFLCGRVARAAKTGGAAGRLSGIAWRVVLSLASLLLWAAALLYRAPLAPAGIAALVTALVFLAGIRPFTKNRAPDGSRFSPCFLALAAALTLAAAIPLLLPGWAGAAQADEARRAAARMVQSLRYEGSGWVLPDGDFGRIADVKAEDAASYYGLGESRDTHVYYFRGFVGEDYTSGGWAELSPGRKAEYATLFSWLHDRGFYGQNQYALLTETLGFSGGVREVPIVNAGSSARYLYTPYEAGPYRSDKARIGDENCLAGGLRGEAAYSIALADGAAISDERLFQALAEAYRRGGEGATQYLTSENAYRDYVYENYLGMPDEARGCIERYMAGLELPDKKIVFSDAKLVVNTYLSQVGYAQAPEEAYVSGDFLAYLLEKSGEGNSLHLATAAVMMFRYLGVPARYVEGFRLTQGGMDAAMSRGAVDLLEGKPGAWAEIYRDGVGFVPFEMEPPDLTWPEQPPRNIDNPDVPLAAEPPKPQPDWYKPLLWLLVILCLLLLIAMLILVTRRAVKRRRLASLLSVPDNAEAVSRTTSYLIRLLVHAGIPYKQGSLFPLRDALASAFDDAMGEEYATVVRVQQAALFSGRGVGDADRARVGAFLDGYIARLKAQAGFRGRLRLKWIDCVF